MTSYYTNSIDGTTDNVTLKTDGAILETPKPIEKYVSLNIIPEEFRKIKSNLISNPMVFSAGIDGYIDTFDEFRVGQEFIMYSGAVSERLRFKILKMSVNNEGHVSNVTAILVK